MTATQMSHEFDLLWNNIMSNQAPGLNDYEKSVFLTKAQDEIVKNYLVPQSPGNLLRAGVEDIAKRQADFKNLIVVTSSLTTGSGTPRHHGAGVLVKSLPSNLLAILTETVLVSGSNAPLAVMPLTTADFLRLMSKPYKYPLKGQCWRLMNDSGDIEIIPPLNTTVSSYVLSYVRRPSPIVIGGGSGSGSGSGSSGDSEVSESLHEDIVQRAVELAKGVWSSSDNFVAMGRRTE